MALNFFLSLRTGPMVVSWNTGSCRQPAVVTSYVQCQCLAVAVQDRRWRISREVTKLQPAACQGFSPPPPPPSRASLPYSLLSIRFQSISLLLHLDSQKNNWLTSFQRAEIYSVTRQKTRCAVTNVRDCIIYVPGTGGCGCVSCAGRPRRPGESGAGAGWTGGPGAGPQVTWILDTLDTTSQTTVCFAQAKNISQPGLFINILISFKNIWSKNQHMLHMSLHPVSH